MWRKEIPWGLAGGPDLARPDIRFVNREPGSGTRVLLDEQLRKLGIDHRQVPGYDNVETTHLAVASCVAKGAADVGLGTESVAGQVKGLDFVPRAERALRPGDAQGRPGQALWKGYYKPAPVDILPQRGKRHGQV